MKGKKQIRLKPILQKENQPKFADSDTGREEVIFCPNCNLFARWNLLFSGYLCPNGHLVHKPDEHNEESIAHYRNLAARWERTSRTLTARQLQNKLSHASGVVEKLLDECEWMYEKWSRTGFYLGVHKEEVTRLQKELFHIKESLDFARTKDAEILRLGGELRKATDQLDDLKSALATANADREAIQERNQELEAKLGKLKAKMDEPPALG